MTEPEDLNHPGADLILHGGRIATMDRSNSFASAVAVRDGRIQAVGSDDVLRFKGAGTEVIELGGRTVIPALNDSHMHLVNGGNSYNLEVRWDGVPSLADALRLLRRQVERTPPGQWVRVVGGWSEFQFAECRMPTLEELDSIAPDTPVFVMHMYLRGLLNRAALRALGWDRNTPEVPGGEIVRDAQGNPTGLLLAKPSQNLLLATLAALPRPSPEQLVNSTQQFARELNRLGITSVVDGGVVYPGDASAVQALHQRGQLTVRTALYMFSGSPGQELADYTTRVQDTPLGGDDYLGINGVGEVITWSAIDGTANFLAPGRSSAAPPRTPCGR